MAGTGSVPSNCGTYELIVEVIRGLDEPQSLYFKVAQHTPLRRVAGAVADVCKKPVSDVLLYRSHHGTEGGHELSVFLSLKEAGILEDATISCEIVEKVRQQWHARGHRSMA
jgi:hypothetical protein